MKKLGWLACCLVVLAGCNRPDPALSVDYIVSGTGRTVGQWLEQLREESDDDNSVLEVVEAMQNLGPDDKEAVPALVAALQDENPKVRWVAVTTLGQIQPTDKDVEYAVARAMDDKDPRVVRAAIRASQKMTHASIRDLLGSKEEQDKNGKGNGERQ
jgi:HEAT repeat protein